MLYKDKRLFSKALSRKSQWILWLALFFLQVPNSFALTTQPESNSNPQPKNQLFCQSLQAWSMMWQVPSSLQTISERQKFIDQEYSYREQLAESLFSNYLHGQIDFAQIEKCWVDLPMKESLLITLQAKFLLGSLQYLERSSSSVIKNFIQIFKNRYGSAQAASFKLVGHTQKSIDGMKAGFHRADKSIFMDISKISRSEWMVILVHELSHSLDSEMNKSIPIYNNEAAVQKFVKWSQAGRHFQELNPREQQELSQWLEAGLSRGLFAEYRAWWATVQVYNAGLKDKLWEKIEWLEDLQSGSLYLNLDKNFKDPTESVFKNPLFQEGLAIVREKYRKDPAQLELGILDSLNPRQ